MAFESAGHWLSDWQAGSLPALMLLWAISVRKGWIEQNGHVGWNDQWYRAQWRFCLELCRKNSRPVSGSSCYSFEIWCPTLWISLFSGLGILCLVEVGLSGYLVLGRDLLCAQSATPSGNLTLNLWAGLAWFSKVSTLFSTTIWVYGISVAMVSRVGMSCPSKHWRCLKVEVLRDVV